MLKVAGMLLLPFSGTWGVDGEEEEDANRVQTILKIANVDLRLVPSSNHASPSGALPFLILRSGASAAVPLTGEKIARFAKQHAPSANLDDPSPRIDAYQALIAHSVRPAWVR